MTDSKRVKMLGIFHHLIRPRHSFNREPYTHRILDTIKTCRVCKNLLDDGRIIRCGHTFCIACIKLMSETSELTGDKQPCPVCGEDVDLNHSEISSLPQSFVHEKLLHHSIPTSQHTSIACSSCDSKALSVCLDGCGGLCYPCFTDHNQSSSFTHHSTTSIFHYAEMQRFSPLRQCDIHSPMEYSFYDKSSGSMPFKCESCIEEESIAVSESCMPIEEWKEEILEEGSLLSQYLKQRVRDINADILPIKKYISSVKLALDTEIQKIKAHFQTLHEYLNNLEKQVYLELNSGLESCLQSIQQDEKMMIQYQQRIQRAQQMWDDSVAFSNTTNTSLLLDLSIRDLRQVKMSPIPPCKGNRMQPIFQANYPTQVIIDISRGYEEEAKDWLHIGFNSPYERDLEDIGEAILTASVPSIGQDENINSPMDYSRASALAVNQYTGAVYVLDQKHSVVHYYNYDLAYIGSFGGFGSSCGQFSNPTGIAVSNEGRLAIADPENSRVEIYDSDHLHIRTLKGPPRSRMIPRKPHAVAFDSFGNLFATDPAIPAVHVWNQSGTYVKSFAKDIARVEALAINHSNEVVLFCSGDEKMYLFSNDGEMMKSFSLLKVQLRPCIAIGPDNGVIVGDYANNCITFFSPEGELLRVMTVSKPTSICFGPYGAFYVALGHENAVQRF